MLMIDYQQVQNDRDEKKLRRFQSKLVAEENLKMNQIKEQFRNGKQGDQSALSGQDQEYEKWLVAQEKK